jgi:hypothetical protein
MSNWGDDAVLKEASSDDPVAAAIRKFCKSNTRGYNYVRDFKIEASETRNVMSPNNSDNGKEFIASIVVDLLKESNPNCYVVTGHPRTPRDQGSVESANNVVQQVLKRASRQRIICGPKRLIGLNFLDRSWRCVTVILAYGRIASQATRRSLARNIINNSNVICLKCMNVSRYSRD